MAVHDKTHSGEAFSLCVPRSKSTCVSDLRESFGEPGDSPNIERYQSLPMKKLQDFTDQSVGLRASQIRSGALGVSSFVASGVALATDFKSAAAGLLAVGTVAALNFYRSYTKHERLHREILDLTNK